LRPEVVLTHAYEGGHPDHDATAFGVHVATRLMCSRGHEPPAVLEFASYHERDGRMIAGAFVADPDCPAMDVPLSAADCALKRRMYDCYATQRQMLRLFAADVERYRVAPRYDFCAPPPPGAALYDRFPWGVRSAEWRALARQALSALQLEGER
jgi:LmbE family N-acetylglucosaminyl deacetylase